MNAFEQVAEKAKTGIWGLDNILADFRAAIFFW